MKNTAKLFGWIMAVLFAAGAVVQYNDPDPALWMVVYGAAAFGSAAFAMGKLPAAACWGLAVLAFIGAGFNWPETFEGVRFTEAGMANMNIEEGREALGLVIIGITYLLYGFIARRS